MINILLRYLLLSVIICPLASPILLSAQSQQSQDTLELEMAPIEVKSVHSSITTDNLTRSIINKQRSLNEINSSASMTLDKLTYDLPGIWVNNRHNYAFGQRMLIRGLGWRSAFGIRGIQVILDGIPLTTADGQTVTDMLDPAFIRNIEVLRGPASTYWGNSSGGVVYMSSTPNYSEAPLLRVRGIGGTYGLRKTEGEFIHQFGPHKVHLFGSYFKQDGFRDHSYAEIGRIGLTSQFHLTDESNLRVFGLYASRPHSQNPSSLSKQVAEDNPKTAYPYFKNNNAREKTKHAQAGFTYYRQLPVGILTVTGYGIYRNLISPLPFAYIDLQRQMGGTRFILEQDNEKISWNVGVEMKYQHDDRINRKTENGEAGDKVTLNQLETVTNMSGFGTLTYQPVEDLNVSGGLRYDWLRFNADDYLLGDGNQSGQRSFQAVSPTLGLAYKLDGPKIFLNASTAFEAPTTTELVNRPSNQGGFNQNIEPEKTVSFEAGIRNHSRGKTFSYDLTLYNMWIDDFLLPYQLSGSDRVYYRNEGKTNHQGIELSGQARLFPNAQLKLTYNYIRARFLEGRTSDGTEIDNNRIPGVPNHRISASGLWTPGSFRVRIMSEWVSRYPANSLNTYFNDRYLVLDGRVSHTSISLGKDLSIQPFLEVDNINNNRYNSSVTVNARDNRYYEPAPGRHVTAGFAIEFY